MTEPARRPFRAGLAQGEEGALPGSRTRSFLSAAGAVTLLADVSEFQPDIDAAYLRWSKAIIIRVAYGDAHDDRAWYGGARRDFLHAGGARYLGMYQYLVAGQDITAQARAFCRLVKAMRPGEDLYADIEEGTGNLQQAWVTWANVVHGELGHPPKSYSGEFFARAHGLAPVRWVASYGAREPSDPHDLWQFTSTYQIPGVGTGDCSVARKTIGQLAAMAWQPPGPQPVKPPARVPAFPFPAGHYLGVAAADPDCHSGSNPADRPRIAVWQAQMARRGWAVTADGMFGAQSDRACRLFQAEKRLTADGKVGPVTWAAAWAAPVA